MNGRGDEPKLVDEQRPQDRSGQRPKRRRGKNVRQERKQRNGSTAVHKQEGLHTFRVHLCPGFDAGTPRGPVRLIRHRLPLRGSKPTGTSERSVAAQNREKISSAL